MVKLTLGQLNMYKETSNTITPVEECDWIRKA